MSQATSEPNSPGNSRLFLGCFVALVATAFGFIVRASLLEDWRAEFNLSNEQAGYLIGAGLYPFAISIILFSLFLDKFGYGRAMVLAFVGHALSVVLTIYAGYIKSWELLYVATFIFALANGVVEAVINPVIATIYHKNKTHWFNILHAGWPGGLVLGGLLAIAVGAIPDGKLPGSLWQWQMGLLLIPTIAYGFLLLGQKFPVQERVAAGVSYRDMLKEFGWGSSYIVAFLLIAGFNQMLIVAGISALSLWTIGQLAVIPTLLFAVFITDTNKPSVQANPAADSFGRPMFVFLLLVMFLLATTELGTDNWMPDIVGSILGSGTQGTLFLVYTSAIMFVLRFFAGPIVHRISPLGLLLGSSVLATIGLLWLANAGAAVSMLFLAATVYALGKTFFWPTTLGIVSERFPKGGALMLNAIAGVGMLAVGTLGGPLIGTMQDMAFDKQLSHNVELHQKVVKDAEGILGSYEALDQKKLDRLKETDEEAAKEVNTVVAQSKQSTLAKIAALPAMMFFCYLILIFYFRAQGGYRAEVLPGHATDDE